MNKRMFVFGLLMVGVAAVGRAEDGAGQPVDLFSLSLEQLLHVKVTSVSKTPQDQFRSPAAVYVLTGDDIRRSGVTSLPEALRLIPGVDVAQVNANQWAVGIRGFQSQLARATLVMIDGRTVYSPLSAGTFWDVQDTMLEDVDRIEVILGPGGSVWGANAVNGVINIITKSAKDTHGLLLTAGGGSEERGFGGFRYGGQAGDNFHYRFYGKYFDRDESHARTGTDYDAWNKGQAGFRTDWDMSDQQSFTLQGDAYDTQEGERLTDGMFTAPFSRTFQENADLSGENALARWTRRDGDRSRMSAQVYFDRTDRNGPDLNDLCDTLDADFQHSLAVGGRHRFTYGTGYRIMWDYTDGTPQIRDFLPEDRRLNLWSLFAQDEIALIHDRLNLTVGSKAERNDYTGWEHSPSGRLAWTPTDRQTVWGAVSRAVRTPSRVDRDPDITIAVLPGSPPTDARLVPNGNYDTEDLRAYELGYRLRSSKSFLLSLNGFYNHYDNVQSLNIGAPFIETTPGPAKVVLPFFFQNGMRGNIYGGEINPVWDVLSWWRLDASYSYAHIDFERRENVTDGVTEASLEGSSPAHQASFRSSMTLPGAVELDPTVRYVSRIRAQNTPAYWSMDMRVGWHIRPSLELSLVGQNLLQPRHMEYGTANEIERGGYAKLTWRR